MGVITFKSEMGLTLSLSWVMVSDLITVASTHRAGDCGDSSLLFMSVS